MCSPSVPPAPDYTGAALAQGETNKQLATQATWANRPAQNTPWGSTFWTQNAQVDPATGEKVTAWTQNQRLDPALQGALNDQLQLQGQRSDLALGFGGRVADAYSTPFDWSNLPSAAGTPQQQFTQGRDAMGYISPTTQTTNEPAFAQQRTDLFNQSLARMAPEHDRQTAQLQTQLANQGLTPGSQAYNMELQRLSDQQSRERYNALEQSGNEQARMQQMMLGQQGQAFGQQLGAGQFFNQGQQQLFGQDLAANAQNFGQGAQAFNLQNAARQQAIAEQMQQRGMPLNEMNALLSGQQVNAPPMPQFATANAAQGAPLLQAAQMQGQYGTDVYNAGQLGQQGLMSGLFGLGGATSKYWWPMLFGS